LIFDRQSLSTSSPRIVPDGIASLRLDLPCAVNLFPAFGTLRSAPGGGRKTSRSTADAVAKRGGLRCALQPCDDAADDADTKLGILGQLGGDAAQEGHRTLLPSAIEAAVAVNRERAGEGRALVE
jgi:hypothetical protein